VTYRTALRRLASGVTVVTTRHDDVDHAMTASAVTSVSLRPPLVLVCVEKVARFHRAVLATGVWGVSILSADAADVASHLASRGRPLHGQLDGADVHRGQTGVPLVGRALAWLECRTWAVYDGGDHSIVVGEVIAARTRDEDSGGATVHSGQRTPSQGTSASLAPLVYVNAAYHTVTRLSDPSE
jgi:flavin reductase (DIM6/NTAB) family NADH-FMN oxidoreductase RutF